MDKITELENKIAQLQGILYSMDKSIKMLIQRDLELKRSFKELSEFDRNKSEFVAIAAHQMRTPLSAINWSQQMLKQKDMGELNENQQQIVDQTLVSVNSLITLVNNMLTVDHLELGKGSDQREVVNLTEIINTVIASQFSLATKKHIRVSFPQSDYKIQVLANKEQLTDVFENLFNNSLKYTNQNGKIDFTTKVADGRVTITVSDSGVGIPDDYKSSVFSRFTRAENAKKIDPNGSGLGLYIVKSIIDAHNGTINFESSEGKGTIFTITLSIAE